jgi:hypothetical protein
MISVCGLVQVTPGTSLELSDQKAQGFLILIAFTRWFLKHVRKVFDEMSVMT